MIRLRAGAATDIGLVRTANQDQLLMADPLYAVADGMGGAAAGEVASQLAVDALGREFEQSGAATADNLVAATLAANRTVWDEAEAHAEMRGMGTTLVAVALTESGELAAVNVGDSRLYAFHDGELRQVSEDHNLVTELVVQGRITKEQAEFHPRRNVITRVLGVEPDVEVDLFVEEAVVGDRWLLCSDGLPREVSDDFMASMLRRLANPAEAAKALVNEARRRGGNDNITVVVVDVVDEEPPEDGDATVSLDPQEPHRDRDGSSGEEAGETKPRRRRRPVLRRAPPTHVETRPKARFVTLRVVAFMAAIVLVAAAGIGAIVWYARSGWFVKLDGQRVAIYQGRPGGVLWMQPTLAEATSYTTSEVLAVHLPALEAGVQEPSLGAARLYVQSLVDEKVAAEKQLLPPTTLPPPTTVAHKPTSTTVRRPTTSHPATAPPTTAGARR
jgi:protein phosphatase